MILIFIWKSEQQRERELSYRFSARFPQQLGLGQAEAGTPGPISRELDWQQSSQGLAWCPCGMPVLQVGLDSATLQAGRPRTQSLQPRFYSSILLKDSSSGSSSSLRVGAQPGTEGAMATWQGVPGLGPQQDTSGAEATHAGPCRASPSQPGMQQVGWWGVGDQCLAWALGDRDMWVQEALEPTESSSGHLKPGSQVGGAESRGPSPRPCWGQGEACLSWLSPIALTS